MSYENRGLNLMLDGVQTVEKCVHSASFSRSRGAALRVEIRLAIVEAGGIVMSFIIMCVPASGWFRLTSWFNRRQIV